MIKVNELRLGNKIYYIPLLASNEKEIYTVTPRFFSSFAAGKTFEEQADPKNWEVSPYYEPIPLTPEILEKCGFERRNDSYGDRCHNYWLNDYVISYFAKDTDHFKAGTVIYRDTELKSLHHLQNLYFDLTCEELLRDWVN